MKSLVYLLAAIADTSFHDWCSQVGIETPKARLITTPESIAGRGVFATEEIEEGDTVIRIPTDTILHEFNAAAVLPDVTKKHKRVKRRFRRRRNRLLRPFLKQYEFVDASVLWQAELTEYSIASLETNNLWAPWIEQWQRGDPFQRLFDRQISVDDQESIMECVDEFKRDFLPNEDPLKIRAAVDIRIRRLEELKEVFGMDDTTATMYGVVTSRAIDLGDGTSAVIPMFDMLNHSRNPNLVLTMNPEAAMFELSATRRIKEEEELFINYEDEESPEDEFSVLWKAVQWGIPSIGPLENLSTVQI